MLYQTAYGVYIILNQHFNKSNCIFDFYLFAYNARIHCIVYSVYIIPNNTFVIIFTLNMQLRMRFDRFMVSHFDLTKL